MSHNSGRLLYACEGMESEFCDKRELLNRTATYRQETAIGRCKVWRKNAKSAKLAIPDGEREKVTIFMAIVSVCVTNSSTLQTARAERYK